MAENKLQLVPDDIFENFCNANNEVVDSRVGVCETCDIPMSYMDDSCSYRCNTCGRSEDIVDGKRMFNEDGGNGVSSIKIISGHGRRHRYSANSDYNRARQRNTLVSLENKNHAYTGNKFPRSVLVRTANIYIEIQRLDDRRLVKRDDIRNEVLGKLMYEICKIEGTPRRKRDIATFLNKSNNTRGLSEGEKIVNRLLAEGKIKLEIVDDDDKLIQSYTDRYLEALDLEKEEYNKFVVGIVMRSNMLKIGHNSVTSSKVVGAIWVLIIYAKINKAKEDVEKACEIRSNTYTRYSSAIVANILRFIKIFEENGIKHGLEGKIVKKCDKVVFPPVANGLPDEPTFPFADVDL